MVKVNRVRKTVLNHQRREKDSLVPAFDGYLVNDRRLSNAAEYRSEIELHDGKQCQSLFMIALISG
jgi:hypothetical protein